MDWCVLHTWLIALLEVLFEAYIPTLYINVHAMGGKAYRHPQNSRVPDDPVEDLGF